MTLNLSLPAADSSEIVFRFLGMSLEVREDPSLPKGSGKEQFRNVVKTVIGNRACDIQSVSEPLLGLASEDFLQARFGGATIATVFGLDQAFPFLLLGQAFTHLNQDGSQQEDGTSQWVCAGPWVTMNWDLGGAASPNIVVTSAAATALEYGPVGFASATRFKTVNKATTDDEEYRHIVNITAMRKVWDISGSIVPAQGIHTQGFLTATFRGSANRRINSLARVDQAFPFPFQMVRQEFLLDSEEGLEVYRETRHFSSVGPWVDLDRT